MTEKEALIRLAQKATGLRKNVLTGQAIHVATSNVVRKIANMPVHPDSRQPLQNRDGTMNR